MKKQIYPRTIYIKEEWDGDDNYYLANDSAENCAVPGEKSVIGIYELVGTEEVSFGLVRTPLTGKKASKK